MNLKVKPCRAKFNTSQKEKKKTKKITLLL